MRIRPAPRRPACLESCRATDTTEQSAGGNGYLQILAFGRVLSLWRAATHEGHTLRPLTEHTMVTLVMSLKLG